MPNSIKQQRHSTTQGPAALDALRIVAVGVAFHLVAIMSIFDIYFKSPLSHGQTPTTPLPKPPASRLVFIVGDGLRADKCFWIEPNGQPRAPFLHRMATQHGVFGVSHTRVPTESRPGHVAMLAGFYEDPSAVTKGWKENPVEYDHVLRRARYAFAFGAPEIVGLFRGDNVHGSSYDAKMVDFGLGRDVLQQDLWVFDQMDALFERAQSDIELADKLRSPGLFFFLHLLGHDTHGHAYGPQSEEYAGNTRFIDAKIERLAEQFSDFYADDKTAFVFSADHGMSDGRSHGDGHPDNTRTPVIAWGAGIKKARVGHHRDGGSSPAQWHLDSQYDIQQADLTPLIATLLGIPIPLQSEGRLPTGYLSNENSLVVDGLLRNVQQLLENYRVKEEAERGRHVTGSFRPYSEMSVAEAVSRLAELRSAKKGRTAAAQGEDDSAAAIVAECLWLTDAIEHGIRYLNSYNQTLLFILVTFGYIGWVVYALMSVASVGSTGHTKHGNVMFSVLLAALSLLLYGRSAPLHYYLYALFPVFFLWRILSFDWEKVNTSAINPKSTMLHLLIQELLAGAYFDRRVMSVIYGGMSLLGSNKYALGLSAFTILPPITHPNKILFVSGLAMGMAALSYRKKYRAAIVHFVAGASALQTDLSLAAKRGLALPYQLLNWSIVVIYTLLALTMPKRGENDALTRVFAALIPLITVLSVSYEVAFFTCFYLYLETGLNKKQGASPLLLISEFLCAINMAFFGTGNIASLSSFSLPSVYRLMTVFRPFAMGALLILKQVTPLVLLSVALISRKISPRQIILASSLADLITLHFFFLVTNRGSWLEIGQSISRFVISNVFMLVGMGMYGIGRLLA